MHDEVASWLDRAVDEGLRPQQLDDLNVYIRALDASGVSDGPVRVQQMLAKWVPHQLGLNFDGRIELLGYTLEQSGGSQARLNLYFRCLKPPEADYTLWLHQYAEGEEQFVALDHLLKTSGWKPDQIYQDSRGVTLGSGRVRFVLGLWRPDDGSRLYLKEHPDQHEIDLGWIGVD
jgi:hypothetical protein